ncbi:alpha/beta hydrolase family protein [Symbioplanes lichenis]|uniref:alpha/beta hydrolase family protein n=1 Tax=Symbioplanes lichenis TaxID=1629072 RepID=UPI00273861AA|nr:chlorophyllase [Actinoplanes lichenis]
MSVISVSPVVLSAPERGDDLQVRVSAPLSGDDLPVIVFSHGFGESMRGYAPLVDHWTAAGFVVVQPTHLDSRTLNVTPDDPRYPEIWRFRDADLRRVLDDLDTLLAAVPGLAGRVDRDRIAVAGHSWGATTASALLGATVVGDDSLPGADPRVKAGVLLAVAGLGGADLSPFAAEHFAFMSPDFTAMTAPALIVAGDADQSALTVRKPDWWTDAYHLSPAPKTLLTLFGGEHSLGGITGYHSTETTDEDPARVAAVQRVSTAFLLGSPLSVDPAAGQLESK